MKRSQILIIGYISIIALITFGLFRQSLIDDYIGNLWYYLIRFGLIGTFLTCLYKAKDWSFPFVPMDTKPYLRGITSSPDPLLSLRALACMMVLLSHSFLIFFPFAGFESIRLSRSPVWLITSSPWGGVWIFFTLSGYLMSKGFYTGRYTFSVASFVSFYRNRLYRILPVAVVVMFLTIVLEHPEIVSPPYIWEFLRFLTLDYYIVPLGQFWSVNTEMQFYMLAPVISFVLFVGLRKTRRVRQCLTTLVCLTICALPVARGILFGKHVDPGYYFINTYVPLWWNLDLFLIGVISNVVLHWCRDSVPRKFPSLRAASGLTILLYLSLSYVSGKVVQGDHFYVPLFVRIFPSYVALLTGVLIVTFELARERGELEKHPLIRLVILRTQFLGTLTYCIYAWHESIFRSFKTVLPAGDWFRSFTNSLICCVCVAVASVFTYYLVELPFDKRRHRNIQDPAFGAR